MNHKLAIAGTQIFSILREHPQMGKQTRQQCLMQLSGILTSLLLPLRIIYRHFAGPWWRWYFDLHLAQQLAQLSEGIVPLTQPHVVEIQSRSDW